MTEKERMIRDIHEFVWDEMDWERVLELMARISKSEACMDYLLMEIEDYEHKKAVGG